MSPRWEYGSEFHWSVPAERPAAAILPDGALLLASGRDALAALIGHGRRHRGWLRWFIPAYFCAEVTAAIRTTGVTVIAYPDSPCQPVPDLSFCSFQPGDVLFLVNYFGLRGPETLTGLDLGPAELVEDHTHDPWSAWATTSTATYCMASLRKTLPIPDGAALWSPRGLSLPDRPPLVPLRQRAAEKKLAAMVLKHLYLAGEPVAKDVFRRLQIDGESGLAGGAASAASPLLEQLLPTLPWDRWRQRRAANHRYFRQALGDLESLRVLTAPADNGSCSFAAVLHFESPARREQVRAAMLARSMYPAIHWPTEGGAERHAAVQADAERLSRRLLSLPCDFRYQTSDLNRVAAVVREEVMCHDIPVPC